METPSIRVRQAEVSDAEEILAIYAPYVAETTITFETRVPSVNEFAHRMEGIVGDYPYLAIEQNGRVRGYAYAHRQAQRAAYAWNAELSVYLERGYGGHGWGRILLQAVCDLLALQGVRNVFSLVTQPNEPSMHMHEALGFKCMGTQVTAGYKCGAWHDVAWLQKQIGSFEGSPQPRLAMRETDPECVREILAEAERKIRR